MCRAIWFSIAANRISKVCIIILTIITVLLAATRAVHRRIPPHFIKVREPNVPVLHPSLSIHLMTSFKDPCQWMWSPQYNCKRSAGSTLSQVSVCANSWLTRILGLVQRLSATDLSVLKHCVHDAKDKGECVLSEDAKVLNVSRNVQK